MIKRRKPPGRTSTATVGLGEGEAGRSKDRMRKGFDELQDTETNSANKIFILFVTIINNKGGKVYIFTHIF